MTHTKRWLIPPLITPEADRTLQVFPSVLRQILFNRGYATDAEARAFLKAEPNFDTDPFQMTGMQAAVERIRFALEHDEPIAIYGDYDVDGVTSTALLVDVLSAFGGKASGYIPNRFDEGYGLNNEALSQLKDEGVKLIITVDCGIRSPDETQHARAIGLDLIITDHHHPSEGPLPPALAVINPKQAGDVYPDKDLAGVGIAYKLAEALTSHQPSADSFQLTSLLDLVALGTVADLAPLVGENRFLVRRGLRQMRETTRQGLFSLAAVSEINLVKLNATDIGFRLGPRLNAAGRLDEALAAYELLTTTDVFKAGQLAQQLDVQNRERQRITREMQSQAEALALADETEAFLLFAAHQDFNPGVVGLAASRLTETYYRPSIVAHIDTETTRGSCRSIPEFHITDALDQCADILVRHGGHAAAAGFTVENDKLDELVSRLKAIAKEQLGGQDLRPTLTADAEILLTEVRPELLDNLKYLEPTGYGNPNAVFVARDVRVKYARTVGADGKHLKMTLEDESGMTHDAIGFRLGHLQPDLPERVDLMFTYEINEYNGRVNYQLNLKDVKAAGVPD
ncbi:MAG: single-stranded-DNA-specific exonuclease RecJ [Anaerolineales bacterium]|jgi:single-stranded-DNA-specific exonuclease